MTTPVIGWGSVVCPGYGWHSSDGGPNAGEAPSDAITIAAGDSIHFQVGVKGTATWTITGDLEDGDTAVTNISNGDFANLAAGQLMTCPLVPVVTGGTFPNIITATYSGGPNSIEFANGIAVEGTLLAFTHNRPPLNVITGVTVTIYDPAPPGTLAMSVSPSTGVSIIDIGADGGGNVSQQGDGSIMANLVGQGEGYAVVTFSDSGSFTVGASFTTADPVYADTSVAPTINITVT